MVFSGGQNVNPGAGCSLSLVNKGALIELPIIHRLTPAFALLRPHKHVWDKRGDETRGDRRVLLVSDRLGDGGCRCACVCVCKGRAS